MSVLKAAITGVAASVPDNIMTNHDLEKLVDTNDEWIISRTGIKQRHILNTPGKGTSDLSLPAVLELLEKTNTDPSEVDMLICGTVTGDYVFPDTANQIAHKAGIKNAFCYDINAACSGFLYALTTAAKFIETGSVKKAIVVGADKMSSIVDYTDRTTCVIFGDGAGAVLLEPNEEGHGLHDFIFKGDGSGAEYLYQKSGGSISPSTHDTVDNREHFVSQNGRPVFKAAVNGMTSTVKDVLERNNLKKEDLDWLVPHQANLRIINSVADMLDFPIEKVMQTIENYGNTTAGTLPICLNEYEKILKKGDKIMLTAFGGGFTWGSTYLTWAY